MKVYRIETEEGRGPYNGSPIPSLFNVASSKHPMPYEDGIGGPYGAGLDPSEFFGFVSMEQLEAWFSDCFQELADYGYHIAVYELAAVYVRPGGHQCTFLRQFAEKVETKKLAERSEPEEPYQEPRGIVKLEPLVTSHVEIRWNAFDPSVEVPL